MTLHNSDFDRLAQEIQLAQTPVVISETLDWLPPDRLELQRDSLAGAIEQWRLAWESRDTDRYLAHYASDFRSGSMSRQRFAAHKKRVNASKKFIEVELKDIGIYLYPAEGDLALVTFQQLYRSSNFNHQRAKHQYWRRQADGWRIVLEGNK